jgi:hypothetical protein
MQAALKVCSVRGGTAVVCIERGGPNVARPFLSLSDAQPPLRYVEVDAAASWNDLRCRNPLLFLHSLLVPLVELPYSVVLTNMTSVSHPLRDMMTGLKRHYRIEWAANEHASGSTNPTALKQLIQPAQIQSFLACHHEGHTACPRSLARINCWEVVVWAAILAWLSHERQKDGNALNRWPSTHLHAAVLRDICSTYESPEAERAAYEAFFIHFVRPESAHLNLYQQEIQHILDAAKAANMGTRQGIPHVFSADSVIGFETYAYTERRSQKKVLEVHLKHDRFGPPALLLDLDHLGLMLDPVPLQPMASRIMSLTDAGFTIEPLHDLTSWGDTSEPKVPGRLVELHMQPADLAAFEARMAAAAM